MEYIKTKEATHSWDNTLSMYFQDGYIGRLVKYGDRWKASERAHNWIRHHASEEYYTIKYRGGWENQADLLQHFQDAAKVLMAGEFEQSMQSRMLEKLDNIDVPCT